MKRFDRGLFRSTKIIGIQSFSVFKTEIEAKIENRFSESNESIPVLWFPQKCSVEVILLDASKHSSTTYVDLDC